MKINNQPPAPTAAQTGKTDSTQSATAGRRGGQSLGSSGIGADGVELSGLAGRISKGLEAAEGSRAEYVNRIAESLRTGSYQVDSLAISRGLIDEAVSKK
jgi:flagellar biosynthesis anti-sigma factor FlgM